MLLDLDQIFAADTEKVLDKIDLPELAALMITPAAGAVTYADRETQTN